MSLSLLDNQTRVSPGSFFPQLGGGGGGGVAPAGISTNTVSASSGTTLTLEVSSGQPFLTLDSQLSTIFAYAPIVDVSSGDLQVSSINGGAYPPSSGVYPLISTIIPQSGVSFTNVSTNSGFVTTESVDMKLANEYLVSGEVVFTIGDSASGLSIQPASGLAYGAAVMQSNQNGASFSFNARPSVTDATISFLVATTSATPASGTLRNLVVTNLGVRGANL